MKAPACSHEPSTSSAWCCVAYLPQSAAVSNLPDVCVRLTLCGKVSRNPHRRSRHSVQQSLPPAPVHKLNCAQVACTTSVVSSRAFRLKGCC
eukprot:6067424-Amphidinium_carterae.2